MQLHKRYINNFNSYQLYMKLLQHYYSFSILLRFDQFILVALTDKCQWQGMMQNVFQKVITDNK